MKLTCPLPGQALRSGRRRSWCCAPCSSRRCQWRRWPTRTATRRESKSRQSASAPQPLPPRSSARGGKNTEAERVSLYWREKVRRTLLTKQLGVSLWEEEGSRWRTTNSCELSLQCQNSFQHCRLQKKKKEEASSRNKVAAEYSGWRSLTELITCVRLPAGFNRIRSDRTILVYFNFTKNFSFRMQKKQGRTNKVYLV